MRSSYSSSNLDDDPDPDYTAYNPKKGVAWAPRGVHVYEDPTEDPDNHKRPDTPHRPLRRRSSALSLYGSLSNVFGSLTNLLTPKLSRKNSCSSIAPQNTNSNHINADSNNSKSSCGKRIDNKCPGIKPSMTFSGGTNSGRLRSAGSMNDLNLLCQQSQLTHKQLSEDQQPNQQRSPYARRYPSFSSIVKNSVAPASPAPTTRASVISNDNTSSNNNRSQKLRAGHFRHLLNRSRDSLHSEFDGGSGKNKAKSTTSTTDSPDSGCRIMDFSADDWQFDSSSHSSSTTSSPVLPVRASSASAAAARIALEAPSFADQEHDRTAELLQQLLPAEDVSYLAVDRRNLRTGRLIVNGETRSVCTGSLRTKSKAYPSRIRAVSVHIHKSMDQKDAKVKLVKNVASMRRLGHRNVAKVFGLCIEGSPHTPAGTEILVMTERTHFHLNLRRLLLWIEENNPQLLTPYIVSTFGIQICYGLRYLEKNKILHTNLTTTSVLLDNRCVCKLHDIDFQTLENRTLNTRWLPLETFLQSLYTFRSVVWTFGVVLWEMATLCCELPYPHLTSLNDIILYLAHGKRLIRPESCPRKLYRLMCLCWNEKPKSRPSLDDLIVTLTAYRQTLPQSKSPEEVFPDRDEFWEDNSWMDDLDGVYDFAMVEM